MKRSLLIVTALLAVCAVAGCRARDNTSAPVRQQPAAAVTQAPVPSIAPQVASSKVAVNLSDVDGMLAELDRQLAEAAKTPDADE